MKLSPVNDEFLRPLMNVRIPAGFPSPADDYLKWLVPDLTEEEIKEIMDYEMPSENLDYYPVYTIRSDKPRPDYKAKNERWEWEGLEEIVV